MIKKMFFIGMAAVAMAVTSCGDGLPKDMCDCIEVQVEFMKETADLDFDDPKIKEIETKYEAQTTKCEELSKEYETKFEGMSQEEVEKEQKAILDGCPAYEEMEKLMDAQMKKFQESMQNMDMEMDPEMNIEMDPNTEAEEGETEMEMEEGTEEEAAQ
jgi:hypothetical protein